MDELSHSRLGLHPKQGASVAIQLRGSSKIDAPAQILYGALAVALFELRVSEQPLDPTSTSCYVDVKPTTHETSFFFLPS
jgi:hypothetical protein